MANFFQELIKHGFAIKCSFSSSESNTAKFRIIQPVFIADELFVEKLENFLSQQYSETDSVMQANVDYPQNFSIERNFAFYGFRRTTTTQNSVWRAQSVGGLLVWILIISSFFNWWLKRSRVIGRVKRRDNKDRIYPPSPAPRCPYYHILHFWAAIQHINMLKISRAPVGAKLNAQKGGGVRENRFSKIFHKASKFYNNQEQDNCVHHIHEYSKWTVCWFKKEKTQPLQCFKYNANFWESIVSKFPSLHTYRYSHFGSRLHLVSSQMSQDEYLCFCSCAADMRSDANTGQYLNRASVATLSLVTPIFGSVYIFETYYCLQKWQHFQLRSMMPLAVWMS